MMVFSKKCHSIALMGSTLCALMSSTAQAGFEFMPSVSSQPQAQAATAPVEPVAVDHAPMPILPAVPVTAQPLPPIDMTPPPQGQAAEIYIPRSPEQAPAAIPMKAAASKGGALVIDPYPLQSATPATHGNNGLYVEQAMMQAGGALKGIAAPGANYTSQITNNATNLAIKQGAPVYPRVSPTAPINNGGLTPMPSGEVAPISAVERAPVYPAPAAVQPQPVMAATPVPRAPSAGFSEAVGFGKELPLALALSQVVPPEYSFSFGQNVNVGSTVSWQGGKSWDAVLQEMLAPVGMKAVITGNQVIIQNA